MKQVVVIFMVLATLSAYGQKLKVNKIDEFTGKSVKETNRILLFSDGLMDGADFRIRKIDSVCFLDLRWGRSGIFSVHKDAELIFLMRDKSTYTLRAAEYEIATRSEYGQYSGNVIYANIEDLDLKGLEPSVIAKVRLQTPDGYVDYSVKEKNAVNVANAVKLVNQ